MRFSYENLILFVITRLVQIVFLSDRLFAQLMLRRHRVMTAGIALQNCSAAAIVQTVTNYTEILLFY